jgi:hypothetical protein
MEVPEVVNPEIGHIRKAVVGNQGTVDGVEQSSAKASSPNGIIFLRIRFAIDGHG